MEEQAVYDDFDFTIDVFQQPNNAQARPVSSLGCPSNPPTTVYNGITKNAIQIPQEGQIFSQGNYAAYVSPVHVNHQRRYPAALGGFKPGERYPCRDNRVDGQPGYLFYRYY